LAHLTFRKSQRAQREFNFRDVYLEGHLPPKYTIGYTRPYLSPVQELNLTQTDVDVYNAIISDNEPFEWHNFGGLLRLRGYNSEDKSKRFKPDTKMEIESGKDNQGLSGISFDDNHVQHYPLLNPIFPLPFA
jgi:hypothetical protein